MAAAYRLAERANEIGNAKFKRLDFSGAVEEYTRGLEALKGDEEDNNPLPAAAQDVKQKAQTQEAFDVTYRLLCNRASCRLRKDQGQLALGDCNKAIALDRANPKAWFKSGLAHMVMRDYVTAKKQLEKSQSLDSKESEIAFLIETCEHFAANRKATAELEKSEKGREFALFFSQCREHLLDDDNDWDAREIFEQIDATLHEEPTSKLVFDNSGLDRVLLLYFTDSYGDSVCKVLQTLASGPHCVELSTAILGRLLSVLLDKTSYSDTDRERAVRFLAEASQYPIPRSWTFTRPCSELGKALFGEEASNCPVAVLQTLFVGREESGSKPLWASLPIDCASAFVKILRSYSSSRRSCCGANVLARLHVRPIKELTSMFQAAESLRGAFDELQDESIPSHFDRVTNSEEAERFFLREKKRMYNLPVVTLKHSILEALNAFVREKDFLTSEAFAKDTTSILGKKGALRPTSLLVDLLSLVRDLDRSSPLKSTPILGYDGLAKAYEKKPFAADFRKNPFGDAFIEEGEEGEGQNETMLEKSLDILLGCASLKNAAITLCSRNVHDILSRLGKYATKSIVFKVMKLYSKLFVFCPAFVSEVTGGESDMIALIGLLLTRKPELQVMAMNKVLLKLSTCSGDDFAWFVGENAGLDECYTILCKLMAESRELYKDHMMLKKEILSEIEVEVIELCRSCYLQCLERCRLQGKLGSKVPRGGAWNTFGDRDIIQMENFLLGKAKNGNPYSPRSSQPRGMKEQSHAERNVVRGDASAASSRRFSNEMQKGFFGSRKTRSSRGGRSKKKQTNKQPDYCARDDVRVRGTEEEFATEPPGTITEIFDDEEDATLGPLPAEREEENEKRGGEPSNDEDPDELKVVWDNTPSEEIKKERNKWANMGHRDKLSWTQSNTEVTVTIKVPRGTRAKDLDVVVTPTRLLVKLKWYGRVFDGPLSRRCKASESWWMLDDDEGRIDLCIPKDDTHFWRSLFEGGEMKSYYEILQELVQADEPIPSYDELPGEAKDLVDELRERQELVSEGLIDPDIFDDFRCVLSDGDGAK
jgi:tetratricopeptide (TPR) repeat protein